jgi:cytochrome c peroxidase
MLLRSVAQNLSKRVVINKPLATVAIVNNSIRNLSTGSSNNNNHEEANNKNSYNSSNFSFRTALLLGGLTAGGLVFCSTAPQDNKKPTPSNVDYNKVRKSIADILDAPDYDDGSLGPVFVRLAWHASGTYSKLDSTGGSNGGCMRFEPESKWGANSGLNIARDALEPVYRAHPGLTYADLYTLAGVVAIEEMGGPIIRWRPGRSDNKDGKLSPADGRLPDAAQGAQHVRDIFYRMGFNDREIVALLGAHSLGRCHTDRSGYDGPW